MSRRAFLERTHSTSNGPSHRRAKKMEKELAKRGRGRLTPGSGNKAIKGDVQKYEGVYRVEAKTTKAASFRVTLEMFEKLEESALPHGEVPAIIVEFQTQQGRRLREVAVIPTEYLKPEMLAFSDEDT